MGQVERPSRGPFENPPQFNIDNSFEKASNLGFTPNFTLGSFGLIIDIKENQRANPCIRALETKLCPRKGEEVYTLLRKKIILSSFKDGQPITEMDVAESMGCSQGTVREALLRLQEEGLVVRQGYRGSVVSPISANEAQVFLNLRAQLESEALVHSMPRVMPDDIRSLTDLVTEMEKAATRGDEYGLFELDQRFHTQIFQIAQMPALVPVLIRCSLYNHRNKISLVNAPRTLLETAQRHRAIVQALANGDVSQAQKVLRHHIQSVVGESLEASDPSSTAPRDRPTSATDHGAGGA